MDYKNIAIAVLVAYVVMDISCWLILKHNRPGLASIIKKGLKKEKKRMLSSIMVAAFSGVVVFYILNDFVK